MFNLDKPRITLCCRAFIILSTISFIFQDSNNSEVELKVLLPDRNICVVTIHRNDPTDTVYRVSIVVCSCCVLNVPCSIKIGLNPFPNDKF